MRIVAMLLGIVGGLLAVSASVAALVHGGPDTVVVGSYITVAAGLAAAIGGAVAMTRPRFAALIMGVAAAAAGLACPGVIPAIADSTIVFVGIYLPAGAFIVGGAVLAWISRERVARTVAAVRTP